MKQLLLLISGEPPIFTPISVNEVVNEEYNEVRFSVVSRRLVPHWKCMGFPQKKILFFFLHVPDCERRNRDFFYLQMASGEITLEMEEHNDERKNDRDQRGPVLREQTQELWGLLLLGRKKKRLFS